MILPERTMTQVGESDPVYLTKRPEPVNLSLHLVITGTVDATVQYSIAPVTAGKWIDHADLTNKTADAVGTVISRIVAYRLKYNSGTGTAKLYGAE